MANRFMVSVAAAALIAGTGFAFAQGTGTSREAPSGGSSVQQSAPSAPTGRDAAEPNAPSSGMKATQSEKSPGASKNQRAQDDMKAGAKGEKEKSAQDNNMRGEKGAGSREMKAEDRDRNMTPDSKGAAENRSQTTTGQAGASAKLSDDQRTRITGVIRDQHIQPLANVNFSVSVGAKVPRTVTFHPLPQEVVTIYPEWRGYEFVRVRDQIVVIDPRTFEIVAILEA
jgi:Protein of unknown function (DUF1236)